MPKANAKDVYYFSHDCNARNDEKIIAMRSVYGLEGYAMFFMIVEIMREQNQYKLEMNKYIWSALAMQMHTEASKVQKFVEDCINEFQLFVLKDEFLYSESLPRSHLNVSRIQILKTSALSSPSDFTRV
jgi:hypothetical protein